MYVYIQSAAARFQTDSDSVSLCKVTNWGDAFWTGMEKMVYVLLFLALLFYSTARIPLKFNITGKC